MFRLGFWVHVCAEAGGVGAWLRRTADGLARVEGGGEIKIEIEIGIGIGIEIENSHNDPILGIVNNREDPDLPPDLLFPLILCKKTSMTVSFREWARFVRLPNVLTVPGDVWAGAALAGKDLSSSPWPAVCLAYLFGMALNDLADLRADRESRPERPLPSGRVPPVAAGFLCAGLGLAALALRPAPSMLALLTAIIAYDTLKERIPGAGPPLMASCRVLAVWIGAGAPSGPPPAFWGVALVWGGLILGVTALARLEDTDKSPGLRLTLLTAGLMLAPVPLWAFGGLLDAPSIGEWIPPVATSGLLLALAGRYHRRIAARDQVNPPDIGAYLGLLFVLQTLVLSVHAEPLAAGTVLAGWPLLKALSRWAPPS